MKTLEFYENYITLFCIEKNKLSDNIKFKFILFIEPKYCKHIIDHTIFIIFSFDISEYILLNVHML